MIRLSDYVHIIEYVILLCLIHLTKFKFCGMVWNIKLTKLYLLYYLY